MSQPNAKEFQTLRFKISDSKSRSLPKISAILGTCPNFMKRDLDLIRYILLDVENWNHPQPMFLEGMSYEGKNKQEIGYQIDLLNDAGYLDARIIKGGQGVTYETAAILRMTMPGHEYLDSVRDPKVWNKTKSVLENVGGSAALEVIKDVAAKVTAELLKPFLGGG
jgi:Hypothetical protein (DUF2513)